MACSTLSATLPSAQRLIRDPRAAAILQAVVAARQPDATLAAWVDAHWTPRLSKWRSPIERAIERGELRPSARDVPLVELVAGPLLLTRLATRRRLARAELRAIAAVVAAGIAALHGVAPTRRALQRRARATRS